MPSITVILPSRNEQFLPHTIKDILKNSREDIEVIAVLDGYYPPAEEIIQDDRVIYLHKGQSEGMRPGINSAVAIAKGSYLMKIDAHCMVSEGFDTELLKNCDDDWVVVPRRKRLDAENWCITDTHKPDIDYMYLSAPEDPNDWGGAGLNGKNWDDRNKSEELKKVKIDDLMSSQGSCWFMKKDYFHFLELMDDTSYGHFWNEMQEIGLKCWLSGGQMKVNKNCWYAHLHKGKKYGRGYFLSKSALDQGATFTRKWMFQKNWHKQTKNLYWLVEHFWSDEYPIPSWNADRSNWVGNYEV